MVHEGVSQVMLGWGGVGWIMKGYHGSCRGGWVMKGLGGSCWVGVGWFMKGWGGS